jgi:phospholipid/cholesterol/gamma-HCH transport system substrate-binding protein
MERSNNGYSLGAHSGGASAGASNPYRWPENLPPTNAGGGPGGRPGCWQNITRELWPAPLLVMDVGASIAPYNTSNSDRPSSSTTCGATDG